MGKRTRKLLGLTLVLILLTASGQVTRASIQLGEGRIRDGRAGMTYHVANAPLGNDANPGTASEPWAHCPGMPGWTGTATLEPGDTVHFDSAGTWETASASALLQAVGGVTYDGSTWGAGTRATLRATGDLHRSVVNLMEDDPVEPTVVRGFEVDANGQETSGIAINWPQSAGSMTGATKRIADCVVHDVYSRSAAGSYEYGIVISSGWGGDRHVDNVEVLDSATYNISRGGINVYAANDDPDSSISNVLVRGCEITATGQDPNYAGSALAAKNHVIDVTFEYNTIQDPERGIGIGISTHAAGFTGPENLTIRHNIIRNSAHAGIYIQGYGDKSVDIYGNLIAQNRYHGINFAGSLADALAARVYNNTFYQNYEPAWDSEVRVQSNGAEVSVLEIRNNIIYADADTRCLIDDDGDVTNHSNNLYYRPGNDVLVIADGTSYTAGNVHTWEPTAQTGDPAFVNTADLPTGFVGAFGVDVRPNADGLNITADSPALDAGAALGLSYDSSINSVTRPVGAGWDIGAYEFIPSLVLTAQPGDWRINLAWSVDTALLPATTWQIDYYTQTASVYTATEPLSTTRSCVLTENVYNYQWYTVTLHAMTGSTSWLSDTVRVMPTDLFVYLPTVVKED
jgi:hypothetical protein